MSPTPNDRDDEPLTYFGFERRKRANPELGVGAISDNMKYPRLPETSPWASDPVPAEPSVDRSEDASIGVKTDD
jgi:hypothetical protein